MITVSANRNPELFWALRGGGGGDFGIVTSMQIEAQLVRGVVTYEVQFDLRNEEPAVLVDVLQKWQIWAMQELPAGASATLKCSATFECVARGLLPGRDDVDLARALRRFTSQFEYEPDGVVIVLEHFEAQKRLSDCDSTQKRAHKVKSLYYDDVIPSKVLETGVTVLQKAAALSGSDWNGFELQRVGYGTNTSGPAGSAADLFHSNKLLAVLTASWDPAASEDVQTQQLDWVRQLHVALAPTSAGAYRNYEDLDMGATLYTEATWKTHPASFYYPGDGVLRLEKVKQTFDPRKVFQHPLTASFDAAEKEKLRESCSTSEWTDAPDAAVGLSGDEAMVLFGVYDVDGEASMKEEQLESAAKRLTHIVYSALQPQPGGWVNLSTSEPAGVRLQSFAQRVAEANPKAKKLVSVGGANGNVSDARVRWLELVGPESSWQRVHFGRSIRTLLDDWELDGVDIDWFPAAEHRTNFTLLLAAVREHLGAEHMLTVHGDLSLSALEGGYDAKGISNVSDLVFLRAFDFEDTVAHEQLRWLTHLNANLFSVNPMLPSGAAGVANWMNAGAPRSKLVLSMVTYGNSFDIDSSPPSSAGRLDWKVRGKSAALTQLSQVPGKASWMELEHALGNPWATWVTEEVPALGGAAAWSEDLSVWVGHDSPTTVRQKAAWIRSMGMAGGLLGPLHMDAYGPETRSLQDALVDGLSIEIDLLEDQESGTNVVLITVVCVIPALFLICCVDAQLRRWGDIRKMHDGLTQITFTTDSWNAKVRTSPLRRPVDLEGEEGASVPELSGGGNHLSDEERGRARNAVTQQPALPQGRPSRRASLAFIARRFSTASSRRESVVQGGARPGSGRFKMGSSSGFLRTSSMTAVQSAFDASMQKGQSSEFDHEVMWGYGTGALDAATLEGLTDQELSRRLALLHKTEPTQAHQLAEGAAMEFKDDGYEPQRGVVRYSRLLKRDAIEWLENPEQDFLNFYNTKRRGVIKLTCVITMYAETPDLLERSLRGIAHGIHQLSTETAFLRSWDEACVVIVSDGLSKLDEGTAEWLEAMGVYKRSLIDDAAKLDEALEGEKVDVALHCFEGLMQFEDWSPTQTLLVIKQNNAGKLDSQRWAFTGIAERLMPVMPVRLRQAARNDEEKFSLDNLTFNDLRALDRYLVTVDAGTQPMTNSLRELLLPMRYDPTIAGTCGHMVPDQTVGNVLVQSQVFEYEHGHVVDKSMESMFGFITVLPGAYSAFRYDAIRRDQWIKGCYRREGPLVDYFKPLITSIDSPALLNMGLAEDRFLCFSLMIMKNRDYSLWYCRRALAVTDVPDTLQAFLQQRRRWNNGAFFTRLFTIRHYAEMFKGTGHNFVKRCGFLVQLLTMVLDSVFVWFASALFYLWITYNVQRLGDGVANAMGPCFLVLYLLAVVAHYDRRVAEIKWVHLLIALVLATEITFCLAVFAVDQINEPDIRLILVVTCSFGFMFLCALLQGKFLKLLAMIVGYLLMYPTYAVLAQLYGFCHVHDVSWGTKGIETTQTSEDKEREAAVKTALSSFRFRILVSFILSNFIFGYVVGYFNDEYNILLYMLMTIVAANCIRYLGSVAFTLVCWLDEALQLTALHGGIGREFGQEYDGMKEQVKRINLGDVRTAQDVYYAIRRRTLGAQMRRNEEKKKVLEEEPKPVELSGHYFESTHAHHLPPIVPPSDPSTLDDNASGGVEGPAAPTVPAPRTSSSSGMGLSTPMSAMKKPMMARPESPHARGVSFDMPNPKDMVPNPKPTSGVGYLDSPSPSGEAPDMIAEEMEDHSDIETEVHNQIGVSRPPTRASPELAASPAPLPIPGVEAQGVEQHPSGPANGAKGGQKTDSSYVFAQMSYDSNHSRPAPRQNQYHAPAELKYWEDGK